MKISHTKHYRRFCSNEEFDGFYDASVKIAEQLSVGQPELPRYRRRPTQFEDGKAPHEHLSARDYYRHILFEACDLLIAELEDRFDGQHIPLVLSMEQTSAQSTEW